MGGGYRPVPGYRPPPDDPPLPGRGPRDRLPVVRRLRAAQLPPVADRPPVPDYPALPHYLPVRDHPPVPDWPAVPERGLRALPRRLAGLVPRDRRTTGTDWRRAAALGYLTVPVFVVPLVIYLSVLRGPGTARRHAAQALNVWFTGALYDLSAVIMAAMLALDSPRVALIVFAPLVAARWLVTLAYLVRAARAAGRGAAVTFPAWLCMRAAR